MILKILLIAILIGAIYLFFFRNKKRPQKESDTTSLQTKEEVMVECAKCNVYTSNKEAIIRDGKFYCSKECAGVK